MADRTQSLFLAASGLLGLCGVALAAAASHGGDPRLLGGASAMCLAHAPALLALSGSARHIRLGAAAGTSMAVGTAIFAGDLALRHITDHGLFPMSAPLGGVIMMAGWALLVVGALLPKKS
ncbi:hypothetical protein ASG25_16415 [Rhizobium sp. Leaf384]|uniref:DUF423 domain-containing protein n=1 Tax=unclassified Rhizobium TaxID=2613769 RepID=UPI000713B5CF|nr:MULTISPECIES: DUF423 domain-containing protein [unclassified Rhizobium]KQR69202.1 hypothetical protein ASG03_08385 [Rhizobium sp. Leaf341]KQS76977.1 hypothetical protein ASG25_16415 [Rhizobium sp. Leaf384]KQS78248.1 hypothetical protein ASG58_07630 [Rhizobium sp. Leaf383]